MTQQLPISAAFLLAATSLAFGQPEPKVFETQAIKLMAETVADGLANPWGLDFLPGGEAIVTEREGRMRVVTAQGVSEPIQGVPEVAAGGQGGLLDVAVSPDFAQSGLIFFSFSEPGQGGAGTAVGRARLVRDSAGARLQDVETIFSMEKKTGTSHHFGSRLVLRPDGTLFVTTGDRGDGKRAQDMRDTAGAVLRINPDGSIPADNPSSDGKNMAPEIWSKGHRNVQGASLDEDGTLLTVEHGAKGGDEVNRPEAGKNYGWPVVSYGVDYSGEKLGIGNEAPGFEQPLHYWDPSIAPSGMVVYRGDMFPEWNGDILIGALKFQLLSRLDRDERGKIGEEERMLEGEFGRIRDVNLAPDGSVWLLTDEEDGAIIRLSRAD